VETLERGLEQCIELGLRMEREGRTALARVEVEEAGQLPAGAQERRHALAPGRPETPRQRAEEGALVDRVEGLLGDGRKEIGTANAIGVGTERRARGFERLGAEVDAQDRPALLGEAAHVPGASAAGNEDAPALPRSVRGELGGNPAG